MNVRNVKSSLLMKADVCNILFIQRTHFKSSAVYSISLQVVEKYKDMLRARKSISSQHASFHLYNKRRFKQEVLL